MELFAGLNFNATVRIALGLLSFIALIVWCRWRGTPEDRKKDGPPRVPKKRENAKQETNSVTSSGQSSFAADRWANK